MRHSQKANAYARMTTGNISEGPAKFTAIVGLIELGTPQAATDGIGMATAG
jgi:hypothetical protein